MNYIVIFTLTRCIVKTRKIPLLARRGAETNERSEFVEAGWWNQILFSTTPSPACGRQAHSPAPKVQTHSCLPSWPGGELLKFLITCAYYFNVDVSTRVGVSLPATIPLELSAMARMMAVILNMSKVPISSLALW
jgi:hypothetical protein